ncbi:MAG: DUF4142 domain-containing protein [Candidatus Korobacteraceae bacterium]
MKITKNSLLAGAASLLLFGTMVLAQSGRNSNMSSAVTPADRSFMDKAAQGGMAEVELGQLAEQNGQSQQVKDFGKRMVTDHTKANDQLEQVASKEAVKLPTTLDAKDQETKEHLSKLKGAAFDKAYMRDMVADHEKDVAEFKREATAAHSPDLKDWVTTTLPTLESHLQEAEKVAPTVTGSAMSKNSGAMNNGSSNTMAQKH